MEEEKADWDLQAVVRRFTTTSTATATTSPSFSLLGVQEIHQAQPLCFSASTPCSSATFVKGEDQSEGLFGRFLDPFGGISGGMGGGLEDLCKPFCRNLQPFNPTAATTCSSASGGLTEQKEQHQPPPPPPQTRQQSLHQHRFQISQTQIMSVAAAATRLISPRTNEIPQSQSIIRSSSGSSTATQSQRTKKRKNVMKKVCHVPAEGLSSDVWAWRKYGQKPIKGSPYPRGYYRCSSSKGCLARKQVERNRSDPNMFVVTYTSEHNHPIPTHRNSLSGSTRQKATTSQAQNGAGAADSSSPVSTTNTTTTSPAQNSCCSPTTSLSPATEYNDILKDDDPDHEMDLCEMILDDELFLGFKELDGFDSTGDFFPDQFPAASLEFPWLASSSSAATAAGGS